MFNPYEPGAFERARAEANQLREDSPGRPGLLRLLDRLESDEDFRARWWARRQEQQRLFDTYGPEVIAYPEDKPDAR